MSIATVSSRSLTSAKIVALQAALAGIHAFRGMLPKSLHPQCVRQRGAPNYWSGVVRKSVAMQNHAGACNAKRPHQGARECARRRGDLHSKNW